MDIFMLQQQLELIQKNGYTQMQQINLNELSLHMLKHIGSTDSYLREQLIYEGFSHLILNHHLSTAQLEKLLTNSLEDTYLLNDISNPNTDSVFTRSYSALLIALILHADRTKTFLKKETIEQITRKLIDYMNREVDFRGYVPQKGWAHNIAHASDAFNELIHNPKTTSECYEEITHCLTNKIFVYTTVYYNNEDERIVTPLLSMLTYEFPQKQLCNIINGKIQLLTNYKKRLPIYEYCNLCANVKTFLRTLFFRTKMDPQYRTVALQTEKMLRDLLSFY
ncbi:hypothetical protein BAMA_15360 [Bacillus manliponensis]|uniref:DUF2785 domain-containing protein n=1 Tax=Bacillus manliponensis TaxID=574376 RepID=A0A073JQR0_9BACI|nr:DUF2785 domain-containing protein [Bacillus manliponensis]KEK17399.1 hypothetical protein BAMA_15360 [Bacillus manliponensis]